MEKDADGRLLVVADSSFLINFLVLDRMDILGELAQFRLHVLNHVRAEIRYENQRARLQAAVESGIMTEIEITDPSEILMYAEFRQFLGDGESASLAVAVSRRWVIAADEKGRFRRELFGRLGENYLLDTAGALVTAIKAGAISVELAEALRAQLRGNRFDMDPRPFDEMIREVCFAMSDFWSGFTNPPMAYRSIQEWQQLAISGQFQPDTQLYDPVRGIWQRAGDHPELRPYFPTPKARSPGTSWGGIAPPTRTGARTPRAWRAWKTSGSSSAWLPESVERQIRSAVSWRAASATSSGNWLPR